MPKKRPKKKEPSESELRQTRKATKPKKSKKTRKAKASTDRVDLDRSQRFQPAHSSGADDPLNRLRGMPASVQAAFDPRVAQPSEPPVDPSRSSDSGESWYKPEGIGTLTCTGANQGSWFFSRELGWSKLADTNVALAIMAGHSGKSDREVKIKEISGLISEIYIS